MFALLQINKNILDPRKCNVCYKITYMFFSATLATFHRFLWKYQLYNYVSLDIWADDNRIWYFYTYYYWLHSVPMLIGSTMDLFAFLIQCGVNNIANVWPMVKSHSDILQVKTLNVIIHTRWNEQTDKVEGIIWEAYIRTF